MEKVLFKQGLQAAYDALPEKEENAVYYITDTQRMYKGSLLIGVGKNATQAAAGLLSAEDKAALDAIVAGFSNKVDRIISGAEEGSRAIVTNEADGGCLKYEHADGTYSAVAVNNGGKDGIAAQLYAIDKDTNKGSKFDVTTHGIYYVKGNESGKTPAQRDIEANEVATKKDITEIQVPEYSLTKEAASGTYAAIYHLTKNGVNIGEAINIPKDQLLKSVEVKVCTEKDVPVEGLEIGDKYLDFTFIVESGAEAHAYIAVKDMAKPYTAGEGIIISADNQIKVDEEVFAKVDYVDASITSTMLYIDQQDNSEHAGRVAGDNLLRAVLDAEIARAKAEEAKKTTQRIESSKGVSEVWNEASGGGAHFTQTNGAESFVGVNDGTDGLMAQIYADVKVDGKWVGSRINAYNDKIYYTNKAAVASGIERNDADYEIATIGVVESAKLVWESI